MNHSIANDYENQLSPIVGGSWASMVNTPLVPMFGNRNGDDGMAQGDYGLASPSLEGASMRLGNWSSSDGTSSEGIVLDDVRKFRRSARVSSAASPGFGVPNGALSGMYDEHAQLQQQQQRRPLSQHNSSQQNAINLGLAGLSLQASQQQQQQSQNRNGAASPGLLSAQQSAITAQQNWRNGLGSPNPLNSADPLGSSVFAQQLNAFGMNSALQNTGNLSANAQLANLFALQQQMMQQQQMQQLGMAAAAAGMSLTPNQLLGMQQQQAMLSPGRMSMGGMSPMMGTSAATVACADPTRNEPVATLAPLQRPLPRREPQVEQCGHGARLRVEPRRAPRHGPPRRHPQLAPLPASAQVHAQLRELQLARDDHARRRRARCQGRVGPGRSPQAPRRLRDHPRSDGHHPPRWSP